MLTNKFSLIFWSMSILWALLRKKGKLFSHLGLHLNFKTENEILQYFVSQTNQTLGSRDISRPLHQLYLLVVPDQPITLDAVRVIGQKKLLCDLNSIIYFSFNGAQKTGKVEKRRDFFSSGIYKSNNKRILTSSLHFHQQMLLK